MFRRKDLEQSSFSVYVEKKTRMLKSRVDYALHGEHVHYYKKKETLDRALDPKCQVCGLLLSEYRTQKKFESLNKAIREKTLK